MIRCKNGYCIYNKDDKCTSKTIALDRNGSCVVKLQVSHKYFSKPLDEIKKVYLKHWSHPTTPIMQEDKNEFDDNISRGLNEAIMNNELAIKKKTRKS